MDRIDTLKVRYDGGLRLSLQRLYWLLHHEPNQRQRYLSSGQHCGLSNIIIHRSDLN
jgi:hypothetical protein